nr:hypothetical protein [Tanacetum cinerariifolium]
MSIMVPKCSLSDIHFLNSKLVMTRPWVNFRLDAVYLQIVEKVINPRAPQADELGLISPLSASSCSCESPGKSSEKTSGTSLTIAGSVVYLVSKAVGTMSHGRLNSASAMLLSARESGDLYVGQASKLDVGQAIYTPCQVIYTLVQANYTLSQAIYTLGQANYTLSQAIYTLGQANYTLEFKVNAIPTNNNQRSSLIPHNSQIAQPGMNTSQDIKMQMVDDNVENQYGNGNVVTVPAEGNSNGINGNLIRCYNCRGEGYYASNYTVTPRKRDAVYLQQQLQIAQEEEAWIQSTQEEFEFMATADAYEENERVKVNCTSEDTLQHASTSGTQSDNDPVYDSDGSTWIKWLQAQFEDLNGKSSDTQYASNTLDPLSQKLEDENVSLEFQLFDKVSEPKGTKKGTRTNTMFTKQSILRKPPSSSYKPKLYSVTPFPKSSVLPKVDKMNALSKPVTSNLAPSTREPKVMKTVNVIAPIIFRTNPSKTSKQQANFDSNGFSSTRVNNTATTRRPHPRSKSNTDMVPSKFKSSCFSNNVKKIEENNRNS